VVQTRTSTSHYEIQKTRRSDLLDFWRENQRYIVRSGDVTLVDTPRRTRRGVAVSADGDLPSLVLDANNHEIEPGVVSTTHRHSWDAIMFVTAGSGWTEVDGQRHEWRAWDTIYLPAWSWHRHGGGGNGPASWVTWSVEPMFELLGAALIEDAGDEPFDALPPRPEVPSVGFLGTDPYSARIRRLADAQHEAIATRILTRYEEVPFRITPRGARSGFLVDKALGHRTTGLTAVMHQLAPGLYQSKHRHGGEAWLYCVEGEGYSVIENERYDWSAGDLVVVDHWAWHQHFNASSERIASLIRVHNFDTLYMGMSALLAPMNLFEEPPKLDAPDISHVEWPEPDANRPHA
jgi:gentisate 1,2-dioxygenase